MQAIGVVRYRSQGNQIRGPEGTIATCTHTSIASFWARLLNEDEVFQEIVGMLVQENDGPIPESSLNGVMRQRFQSYLDRLERDLSYHE